MPFADPATAREYRAGYQAAYRLPASVDCEAEERAVLGVHAAASVWMRGWRAGLSNRQGESMKERKAQWFQKNRAKVAAQVRRFRRAKRRRQAMAVLSKLSEAA